MQNRATLELSLNELKYLQELLSKDAFMPECFDVLKHCIEGGIHYLELEEADALISNFDEAIRSQ